MLDFTVRLRLPKQDTTLLEGQLQFPDDSYLASLVEQLDSRQGTSILRMGVWEMLLR